MTSYQSKADLSGCSHALHKEFELAHAELDALRLGLVADLSRSFPGKECPAKLIQRIDACDSTLAELKVAAEKTLEEKARVMESIQRLLLSNRMALFNIQRQVGGKAVAALYDANADLADIVEVSQHWGQGLQHAGRPVGIDASTVAIRLPKPRVVVVGEDGDAAGNSDDDVGGYCDEESMVSEQSFADTENQRQNKTQQQQQQHCEISPEELSGLPRSVRGRCTLEHVNKVYEVVVSHFCKKPRDPPLSIKQLSKLGARVTGQTGKQVLIVLRHLGLIEMSRDGVSVPQTQRRIRS